MDLIKILFHDLEPFYLDSEIVSIMDSLMETLLKNEVYAHKKNLNENDESLD